MTDINHPQRLLEIWRSEALRLRELIDQEKQPGAAVRAAWQTRANALSQCADELENRLRWSGMLDG